VSLLPLQDIILGIMKPFNEFLYLLCKNYHVKSDGSPRLRGISICVKKMARLERVFCFGVWSEGAS
jgi:hypothetical protein